MMKTLCRTLTICLISMMALLEVHAQSGVFVKEATLGSANGFNFPNPLTLTLKTKEADWASRGNMLVFGGNPTRSQVHTAVFDQFKRGAFFVTEQSADVLPFILETNFNVSSPSVFFDRVTFSVGDIGSEDEYFDSPPVPVIDFVGFLNLQVGQSHSYNFNRSNICFNEETGHAKFLIARMYKNINNQEQCLITVVLPIALIGTSYEKIGHTDQGPFDLITILRPAPGDKSSVEWEVEDEITRQVTWGMSTTETNSTSNTLKANVGASLGPVSAGGSINKTTTRTYANTNGEGNSHTVSYKVDRKFTNDTNSPRFIARQLQVDIILRKGMNILTSPSFPWVSIQEDPSILLYPTGIEQEVNVTQEELLGDINSKSIAQLRRNNRLQEAGFWESAIDFNRRIEQLATGDRKVTGPLAENYSTTKAQSQTFSQQFSSTLSRTVTIEASAGLEIGPLSIGGGAERSTTFTFNTTVSNGNTTSNAATKTVGFSIDDDDPGDQLTYIIKDDPVYGTPIFDLVEEESATSCPYEGGRVRDNPEIIVFDPLTREKGKFAKFSDLTNDQTVTFELEITNNSSEARTYKLREIQPDNPLDADLDFIPNNLTQSLAPGQTKVVIIEARGTLPERYPAYPDINVIIESECGDATVSDSVLLSLYYGDSDINRAPDNNFVENALFLPSDGTLQTQFTNKFGNINQISNINAQALPQEQNIVPDEDCFRGWCEENNSGGPQMTNTVWFKFEVNNPDMVVSLCEDMNAGFNSQLAAYTAVVPNDFNSYREIKSNDNSACSQTESARLFLEDLTIGDTIYVVVDGFEGAQSEFGIRVSAVPPLNDDACDGQQILVDGELNTGFSNFAASANELEDVLAPDSNDPVIGWKQDQVQKSVWFFFAAPNEGEVIIEVLNSTFDSQVSAYYTNRACGTDFFTQYVKLGANDDESALGGGLDSRLELKGLNPGQRYDILVDGYQGAEGTFDLKITVPKSFNDEPEDAIWLEVDAAGQGPFLNGGATSPDEEQVIAPPSVEINRPGGWSDQPNDPRARIIEKSVWFKFKAPIGGAVKLSTCDMSSFILQMAVYEVGDSSDYSTYNLVAAEDNSSLCRIPPNDQYPNGTNKRGSILDLTGLTPDETYYVLIDGSLTASGTFSIDLLTAPNDPPENDEISEAFFLPANGVVQEGYNNLGATSSEDEFDIIPQEYFKDKSISSSVWFAFTGPNSGEAEISVCDMANFDTQLAVYAVGDEEDYSSYTLIAANEDGPDFCATNGDSFLPVENLTPGNKYYIMVDGYGNNQGLFDIVVRNQITPPPANDEPANAFDLPVDGEVQTGFTNSLATSNADEQDIRPAKNENDCVNGWCDDQVDNSVWFKFIAPANGKVFISTCGLADFDTQLALYEVGNPNDYSTFNLLAANDAGPDSCSTFFDSYLPYEGLTGGQTYYIMVDGFDGDNGNFDISLSTVVTTSIPSLESLNRIKVYPNPTAGLLTVEVAKSSLFIQGLIIRDITGKVVYQAIADHGNREMQLDLSTIPAGVLLMGILTNEGLVNKKLVKY